MKASRPLEPDLPMADADRSLTEVIARERPRLKAWLRRQVPDAADVEDILQDAFIEFMLAARLMEPIRHAGAWLFTVIRHRVTDRHRRAAREPLQWHDDDGEDGERLVDRLPDPAAGPEQALERARLLQAMEAALQALPEDQRAVFIAHEIEGLSFKAMAEASGEPVNTLLSRKHYAVKALRRQLQPLDDSTEEPR